MRICVLSRIGRRGAQDPGPPHVFHLGQRRLPVIAILQ